jgi:hypothetical protein
VLLSRTQCNVIQMANAPNSQRAREDVLRAELTEHGKFSELLNMNVPFPADPDVTLTTVQPQARRRCAMLRAIE